MALGTRIVGTGSYLPEKVLDNHDLEKLVDTSDEWIMTRTGISERRVADDGVRTSDLGAQAALRALGKAGLRPEDLDLIVVATITPDMLFPSTACFVQHKIKATNAFAFDVSAACTGFIYGLTAANDMIAAGRGKSALVIGAESLTKFTDYTDRTSCILFGDGAGAVVLAPSRAGGELIYSHLGADGSGWEMMMLPGGGSANPATRETVDERQHYMKLRGREIFKFAVKMMQDELEAAMQACSLGPDDVALVVPHQVNMRILDAAIAKMQVPREKLFVNIDRYGNTSSASVPIALDEASRAGKVKPGDNLVMVGFGAGLTWGSCVFRWHGEE